MSSIQPDIYTPDEWRDILVNAHRALRQNPQDQEALAAIKDAVAALNAFEQAGAQEPTGDRSVLGAIGGAARGLLDIPQGIATLVRHPIKTLGQITGIANIPEAIEAFSDDELNFAAKLEAAIKATPANIGYAPQSALMETFADPSTGSFERGRRATNVASLALLGAAGRAKPKPLGASQFGGPAVRSGPTGVVPPTKAPLPEPAAVFDAQAAAEAAVEAALRRPRPAAQPEIPGFSTPEPFVQGGQAFPRGISVEGPPLKPVSPADVAFSEVRTGAPFRPRGSGGTAQKALTFGKESPLGPAARAEVKGLVGEITRGQAAQRGNIAGLGPEAGAVVGPWFRWQLLNNFVRPPIKAAIDAFKHDIGGLRRMVAESPRLRSLENALIQAYVAGQTEQAQQIADQLASELLMMSPSQEEQ